MSGKDCFSRDFEREKTKTWFISHYEQIDTYASEELPRSRFSKNLINQINKTQSFKEYLPLSVGKVHALCDCGENVGKKIQCVQ